MISSDPNGNRTSLRKRDGSTLTFQYDALNRMSVKVVPERTGLASTHTRDVHYEHDLRGLQTKARFDSLAGEGVSASYDGFGRLASSSINMGGATRTLSAQYNKSGGRTELTFPDAVKMSFAHDGMDRMTGVLEGALGSTVSLAAIAYNNRGERASMGRVNRDGVSYGFDGVSRLKTLADTFVGGAGNSTSTFGYNLASQITGLTRSNDAYAYTASNETKTYAVNGLNQYTSVSGAAQSHDANGNLTGDGTTTYSYDVENRMVGASNGAVLAYDPMGRLFQTSGTSTGTAQFLYDGDELVAEYDGSGNLTRRYVHGAGVDDPLVWYEGSSLTAPRFLHTDHQGSVTSIAKADGTLLNINRYDEYGVAANGNIGRFGYTGQIWLPEVGRWHYKSRTYDAKNGRFDQIDKVGYQGGANLYEYADTNPINLRDPGGNTPETIWDAGNLAIGTVSLGRNLATGNYLGAAVDGVGMLVDAFATATPGLPGGAGGAIMAGRLANSSAGLVNSAQKTGALAGAAAGVAGAVRSIQNNVRNHLTVKDVAGAVRDILGRPVSKAGGGSYQHLTEVTNGLKGLRNSVDSLKSSLSNPNLTEASRNAIKQTIGQTSAHIDRIEKILDMARRTR